MIASPEVLARLQALQLVARRTVAGLAHGAHRSVHLGVNVEFADFKEYAPGDSLRDLDWKVHARTDRLVVRRHQAERDLPCLLVLDASGDLATGSANLPDVDGLPANKWGYAVALTATLAMFLQRAGEPVGLVVVAGEDVAHRYLPPRSSEGHLARIFTVLAGARPAGRAGLHEALEAVGQRVRRRSLVAVVSDFMEEPAAWTPSLLGLAARRADLVALHLMDRRELELDLPQPTLVYSPEGGGDVPIDPAGVRLAFREVVARWQREVEGGVVQWGGRYLPAWTDRALDVVLRRLVRGDVGPEASAA